MDHGSFQIGDVIMHAVPGGRLRPSTTVDVVLADVPIELDSNSKSYLESRIRVMLTTYARPVVEDFSIPSDTPRLVKDMLSERGDIVAHSQNIAKTLHAVQSPSAPEGLLLFIRGTLSNRPCCVIAKIEREEGIKVELVKREDKKVTFSTQYLKDLIFGQATEVYKIGAFHDVESDDRLIGHAADAQQSSRGVATYFLERVLGCRFAEASDVATQRFYKSIQKYIGTVTDPVKAARYEVALLSEMQSQRTNLSVNSFARAHIDLDDRETFRKLLEREGVVNAPFTKDVTLIESSIVRVKIQTSRHATVLAPPDMYHDGSLTITRSDGSEVSQILISDRVTSFSGASGKLNARSTVIGTGRP